MNGYQERDGREEDSRPGGKTREIEIWEVWGGLKEEDLVDRTTWEREISKTILATPDDGKSFRRNYLLVPN